MLVRLQEKESEISKEKESIHITSDWPYDQSRKLHHRVGLFGKSKDRSLSSSLNKASENRVRT